MAKTRIRQASQKSRVVNSPKSVRSLGPSGGLRTMLQRPSGLYSPKRSPKAQPWTLKKMYTPGIGLGLGT